MDIAEHIQLQTASESTTFPAYFLVMRGLCWLLRIYVLKKDGRQQGEQFFRQLRNGKMEGESI